TPPSILAMAADPSVQVVDGFVNLTTDVQDNVGILTVTAAVRGPGFDQNLTMVHASGTRWYVEHNYSAVGHYAFTVWATDSSVNATGAESGYARAFSVTIPPYTTPPLFDPVPWAVAGVTLGVILGALYGMVWRRRPA